MFDSLDTMLIMNLEAEFDRALVRVEQVDFSLPEVYQNLLLLAYILRLV